MQSTGSLKVGSTDILPANSGTAGVAGSPSDVFLSEGVLVPPASSLPKQQSPGNWITSSPFLVIAVVAILGLTVALKVRRSSVSSPASVTADNLDQRLQRAATLALGDRRGAVIVMDPQT